MKEETPERIEKGRTWGGTVGDFAGLVGGDRGGLFGGKKAYTKTSVVLTPLQIPLTTVFWSFRVKILGGGKGLAGGVLGGVKHWGGRISKKKGRGERENPIVKLVNCVL